MGKGRCGFIRVSGKANVKQRREAFRVYASLFNNVLDSEYFFKTVWRVKIGEKGVGRVEGRKRRILKLVKKERLESIAKHAGHL